MWKTNRELEQIQATLEYQKEDLKVFIADLIPLWTTLEEAQDIMDETANLVDTYGWVVVLSHLQKKQTPDYKTFLGSWKLDEIVLEMDKAWANLLIIWNELKPLQIYNINQKLQSIWAKAWDRIDLILKIFEKNAKTQESKLQIELAQIKHMWPRIYGMSEELWSQWSWWNKGSRWKWETNTQIMKTHLYKRELSIISDLKHFEKVRAEHRKGRARKNLQTVWIVGYTNAWKSTLMNLLTNKWVLAEDKLFATLWTSVGKMIINPINKNEENYEYIKPKEILLNDTIWFIRNLPPNLIKAFSSTLEDSIEADILLEVVDASDKKILEKISVVDEILDNIKANQTKIYVFNKIDLIDEEKLNELKQKFLDKKHIFISTHKKLNIEELKVMIGRELES